MKKCFKYLTVLFAFLLVVTGCGKKDPKGTFEKAIDKTSKADSFHQKANLDLGMTAEGMQVNYAVALEGDVISKEDSFKAHYNYSLTIYGFGIKGEIYADINKSNLALYIQSSGKWYKVEQPIDSAKYEEIKAELEKTMKENDSTKELLKYAKEVKEVKSDKKGYTKLSVVFDKDKLNDECKKSFEKALEEYSKNKGQIGDTEKVNEVDEALKEIEENETYKSIKDGMLSEDIKLDIYVKDGYISYFEYDLTSLIKNILNKVKLPDEAKAEFDKLNLSAKVSVELSNFNGVKDIEVPSDVKESAIDYTEVNEYTQNKINEIDNGGEVE